MPEPMLDTAATPEQPQRLTHWPVIILTWVLSAVISVAVVLWQPPHDRADWLVGVAGVVTVLTFLLQLTTAERRVFIVNVSVTLAGALGILFVTDTVSRLVTYFDLF